MNLSETDAAEIAHYLADTLVAIPEGLPSAEVLLFGYFELIAQEAGRLLPASTDASDSESVTPVSARIAQ